MVLYPNGQKPLKTETKVGLFFIIGGILWGCSEVYLAITSDKTTSNTDLLSVVGTVSVGIILWNKTRERTPKNQNKK
jgi:hypothetical protein